ncbi:Uncharacterized protein Adt_14929 [Abeliophyllum distichum]|uniref:Uncharacterized protein n=1 Tax=Abeliophyllum distichum TaxID=126358 RepID=A0ABD1U106_9LAMI
MLPPASANIRGRKAASMRVHIHVENDDDNVTNTRRCDDGTPNECRCKELKISKGGKLDACIAQWLSNISMRNGETELRTLYLKEKLVRIQRISSNQLGNSEATSSDALFNYGVPNILNNMEGVSNEVYMKTIKAFKDLDFRMSFVIMPEIRRGPILELLLFA